MDTKNLYSIVKVKCTSLYSTCSNCTTTCDCKYVLNRHKEWLICLSLRIRNVAVNSIHKCHDLITPLTVWILKSLKS